MEYLESQQVSTHTLRIVNSWEDYVETGHSRMSDYLITLRAEQRLAKLAPVTLLGLPLLDSQHGAQVDSYAYFSYKDIESAAERERNGGCGLFVKGDNDKPQIVPGERYEVCYGVRLFGVYAYATGKPLDMIQDRLPVLYLEQQEEYPEEVFDVLSEEERQDIANWKLQYWDEGVSSEFPRVYPAGMTRDQHVCTLETQSVRCARCRLRRRDLDWRATLQSNQEDRH